MHFGSLEDFVILDFFSIAGKTASVIGLIASEEESDALGMVSNHLAIDLLFNAAFVTSTARPGVWCSAI